MTTRPSCWERPFKCSHPNRCEYQHGVAERLDNGSVVFFCQYPVSKKCEHARPVKKEKQVTNEEAKDISKDATSLAVRALSVIDEASNWSTFACAIAQMIALAAYTMGKENVILFPEQVEGSQGALDAFVATSEEFLKNLETMLSQQTQA